MIIGSSRSEQGMQRGTQLKKNLRRRISCKRKNDNSNSSKDLTAQLHGCNRLCAMPLKVVRGRRMCVSVPLSLVLLVSYGLCISVRSAKKIQTCPLLEPVVHATIFYRPPNTPFKSKAIYICQPGFKVVGDATRDCLHNTTWSGQMPNCIPGAAGQGSMVYENATIYAIGGLITVCLVVIVAAICIRGRSTNYANPKVYQQANVPTPLPFVYQLKSTGGAARSDGNSTITGSNVEDDYCQPKGDEAAYLADEIYATVTNEFIDNYNMLKRRSVGSDKSGCPMDTLLKKSSHCFDVEHSASIVDLWKNSQSDRMHHVLSSDWVCGGKSLMSSRDVFDSNTSQSDSNLYMHIAGDELEDRKECSCGNVAAVGEDPDSSSLLLEHGTEFGINQQRCSALSNYEFYDSRSQQSDHVSELDVPMVCSASMLSDFYGANLGQQTPLGTEDIRCSVTTPELLELEEKFCQTMCQQEQVSEQEHV